jgi:UDP-glucose 4-epimerase/UDP-glucuronate decarboxylase
VVIEKAKMKKKHVLMAGGAGFIGSHLVDRLLRRDDIAEVLVVDNLWTGRVQNLAHITDTRLDFIEADVEHVQLSRLYDEIYHLASPASPPWYMQQPLRTISANVRGGLRLLEALKPGGRICYTSTSEIYGDPLISPQPESYRGSVDCTGPRSAYDEAKRCVEAMLFQANRVEGVRVKVARVFNVFGPRTRPDDGRAVSNFITQALRSEPLTIYGNGLQSRSWGFIDDIVDGLERFFWLDGSDFCGPLNIGNDREIPVLHVAKYIIERHFPEAKLAFRPPVPQEPTNRRPDLTLANRILPGWSCVVSYEEGVDRTLDWFRSSEELSGPLKAGLAG